MSLKPCPNRELNRIVCAIVYGLSGFALALSLLLDPCTAGGLEEADRSRQETISPDVLVNAMGPGINVLDQDPIWDNPSRGRFQPVQFEEIRSKGFRNVRFLLRLSNHVNGNGTINPVWEATLKSLVAKALDSNLVVVLAPSDADRCRQGVEVCRTNLIKFWMQLAPAFFDFNGKLAFEILNEPPSSITPSQWNNTVSDVLAAIRISNPNRNVVVPSCRWAKPSCLPDLRLPSDQHLIVTVHYYDPMRFTHQGAPWIPSSKDARDILWGSDIERSTIVSDFMAMRNWSDTSHRPLYIGEFGVIDVAPTASRNAWLSLVAYEAKQNGFAWAYWEFEDRHFMAYDWVRHEWVPSVIQNLRSGM